MNDSLPEKIIEELELAEFGELEETEFLEDLEAAEENFKNSKEELKDDSVTEPFFDFENIDSSFKRVGARRSKNVRVIFLDVDGVLNYMNWQHRQLHFASKNIIPVDEEKVKIVSKILKKTKAKMIFSSSWRFIMRKDNPQFYNKKSRVYKLKRLFNKYNIKIEDITGLDFVSPDKTVFGRGYEIQAYLERHPEIKKFAIIDDAFRELQNYINTPNLFLTSFKDEGLTEKQGSEIISFLNRNDY